MSLRIDVHSDRTTYHPGDTVRAVVDVSNVEESEAGASPVLVSSIEAVCRGVERVDPGWISSSYFADTPHVTEDSRRVVRDVFATPPARLVENSRLFPGQERRFAVGLKLPQSLPPSFKGTSVRYSYEVVVSAVVERGENDEETLVSKASFELWPNSETQISRKPSGVGPSVASEPAHALASQNAPALEVVFRDAKENNELLLEWNEVVDEDRGSRTATDQSSQHLNGHMDLTPRESEQDGDSIDTFGVSGVGIVAHLVRSRSPGLSVTDSDISVPSAPIVRRRSASGDVGTALGPGNFLSSTMSHRTYNLHLADDRAIQFSLNPCLSQTVHPGSTFGGLLDFRDINKGDKKNVKRCIAVSISLETEEEVRAEWLPPSLKVRECCTIRKVYCEYSELTNDMLMTHFTFSIPPGAPVSFSTPLLTLQWVLRFEFVVGECGAVESSGNLRKPQSKSEQLQWRLPVLVAPV